MLISGEKGDSETDSTDLIIYGLAQDCGWNKIQKKIKYMHRKGLQNKEYLCLYSCQMKNLLSKETNSCGGAAQMLNI